jgi:DNA-binding LacI/PurR family transcriptional regulator
MPPRNTSPRSNGADRPGADGRRAVAGGRRPGSTDVARRAGVSQKTVSRVFNNEPAVTEETRQRVLAAAAELGYRPNGAARALLTGRTSRIGVVALGTAGFGPSSLLVGLERAALRTSFSLSIAHTFEDDPDGLRSATDRLLAQGVDAIILSEPIDDGGAPLEVDVPVLALGMAPEVSAPTVLSVPAAEGGDASAAMTRYLLGLGHRTVHHIAGPQRWWAARARLRNWEHALRAAGAPVPPPLEGDWSPASGYRIAQELARDPALTAIFAANDEMAIGAIHALHAAGKSVPGDVSVAGFDDIPAAAHVLPPLTTISSDNTELAAIGLGYLVGYLSDPDSPPGQPPPHVHQLVIRQSTTEPRTT